MTFCWANILMRLRTTSMPRSFEAFSSKTASFHEAPSRIRDRQRIVVVLPTPETRKKKYTILCWLISKCYAIYQGVQL